MDDELQAHEEEKRQLKKGLVERLVNSGLRVDRRLIEEILKQDCIDEFLREILKDDQYWTAGGPGDQWTPYHVLYILGLKADEKSLEALKYAMKNRLEETGDFVTEELPAILYPSACKIPEKVWELALDKTYDVYVRIAAIRAICAAGVLNEELKRDIADECKKLLTEETNDTLIGLTLPAMAELKDEELWDKVKETYEKIEFAQEVVSREGLEELHGGTADRPDYLHATKDLWNHFSRENLDNMYEGSYGTGKRQDEPVRRHAKKTGRNEPCPCGSGKKYKKCCGKKWMNKRLTNGDFSTRQPTNSDPLSHGSGCMTRSFSEYRIPKPAR